MTASVRSIGAIFKTNDTPTTSYVLEAPADVEVGDLMLAIIATDNTGGATDMEIDPPPPGWLYMSTSALSGPSFDDWMADGSQHDSQMLSKIFSNGDGTTYTFTDGGIAHHAVGVIIVIKEPGAMDAYSSYGQGDGNGYERVTNAAPLCPSVTTEAASLVIRVCSTAQVSNNSTLDSSPAGTTELYRETSGAVAAGDEVQIGASWEVQSEAGATGTAAFALSGNEEWHAHTICIDLDSLYSAVAAVPNKRIIQTYPAFRRKPRLG